MRNMSLRASADFLPVYADSLCELIRRGVNHPDHYATPLEGLKVVVDAGNGSGGFFESMVGARPDRRPPSIFPNLSTTDDKFRKREDLVCVRGIGSACQYLPPSS